MDPPNLLRPHSHPPQKTARIFSRPPPCPRYNKPMRWWSPYQFTKQMERKGVRQAAIARGLTSYGIDYCAATVSSWREPGSTGPKHPIVAIAIADILGCHPEEIAPPSMSNADRAIRQLRQSAYRDAVQVSRDERARRKAADSLTTRLREERG